MRGLTIVIIVLFPFVVCSGKVIIVDPNGLGEYPTIQSAINAAGNGDSVVLNRGVYSRVGNRDLDLKGKAITVRSLNPDDPNVVENTIIDCVGSPESPHRGFKIQHGEGSDTVIAGITVTGGYGLKGGAILCRSTSPMIMKCIIRDNEAIEGGGVYLYNSNPEISNCVIRDNIATQSGGGVCVEYGVDEHGVFHNCLIVSNEAGRDGGGISIINIGKPVISNCTIAGNVVSGGYPSASDPGKGGGLYCSKDSDAYVVNSIISGNRSDVGGQVTVGSGFDPVAVSSNLRIWYSNIPGGAVEPNMIVEDGCFVEMGDGNIFGNPRFVSGPRGDYYLSQIAAGQNIESMCVDSGSDLASALGLDVYTTRSDRWFDGFDAGVVDMGYHYPYKSAILNCKYCDLVLDGMIDFGDAAIIAMSWLDDCGEGERCGDADIDLDGDVDFIDMSLVAKCWGVEDNVAPEPQTAQWAIEPRSMGVGTGSVEMSGVVSVDDWFGMEVEYYFQCLTDSSYDSGWRQSYDSGDSASYAENPEYYVAVDLEADKSFAFLFRVRDRGGKMTNDSSIVFVFVEPENDPPSPNPSDWEAAPYNTGTSIKMSAVETTDDSGGVEYYFRSTDAWGDGDGVGTGHSSGWQSSNEYEDTPSVFDQYYYYRVRARDKFGNETEESPIAFAKLDAGALDPDPPLPNPSEWETEPSNQGTTVRMVARTATDASGTVEYYFRYTDEDGISAGQYDGQDSGWQSSNEYVDNGPPDGEGLTDKRVYHYRVKTRDKYRNMSGESPVAAVRVDKSYDDHEPPHPNPPVWDIEPKVVPKNGSWWHKMSVFPVSDPEDNGEEYRFYCHETGKYSDWRNDDEPHTDPSGVPIGPNEYWVETGARFVHNTYSAQTRDRSYNQNEGGLNNPLLTENY